MLNDVVEYQQPQRQSLPIVRRTEQRRSAWNARRLLKDPSLAEVGRDKVTGTVAKPVRRTTSEQAALSGSHSSMP